MWGRVVDSWRGRRTTADHPIVLSPRMARAEKGPGTLFRVCSGRVVSNLTTRLEPLECLGREIDPFRGCQFGAVPVLTDGHSPIHLPVRPPRGDLAFNE